LLTKSSKKVAAYISAAILVVSLLFCFFPSIKAEIATTFTTSDRFSIPALNGTIDFAVNGSYSKATLENNTWTFYELRLNGSRPLTNLKISTENSNITIRIYSSYINSTRSAALRYTAVGAGRQTVNLGLNSTQQANSAQWSVIITNTGSPNVFLAEDEGWRLLPDGTVIVEGQTGNVSVVRYGFSLPSTANLPFVEAHSVAIVTAIITATTLLISFSITRVNIKRQKTGGDNDGRIET
jgi:hypothetical protein